MRGISLEKMKKAVHLYSNTDMNVNKIAAICEMSTTSVYNALNKFNITLRRNPDGWQDSNLDNQAFVGDSKETNDSTILCVDVDNQLQVTVKDATNNIKSAPIGAAEREDIMEERRFNEAVVGNNFGAIIDALNKIVVELARVQVPVVENIQPQSQVQPQTTVPNTEYTTTPTGSQIAIGNIPNVEVHANASSTPELDADVKPRAILWIL